MFRSPRLLVAARVLAGMSQAELAAAAGVATSVLQAIEQGRSDPKLSTVLALLDALKACGVELVPETERVAGGVLVIKGGETDARWSIGRSSAAHASASREAGAGASGQGPELGAVEPEARL
jgi:transcriptional regulator with XRE-family HTH domain